MRINVFARVSSTALIAAALTFSVGASAADVFPSRAIRIEVPVAAAGWGDIVTRLVAQRMGEQLNQSVIVENHTGAGGLVGIRYTKAERADGYTMLSTGGTIAIQQTLSKDPGFDTFKDFVGVGNMVRSPALIVTGTNSGYKTLSDLINSAKANPNHISYGSAGVGTTTHIAAEILLRKAGVQMMHVPYKGNGAAMPDIMAGRVSFMVDSYGSSVSSIKGGKLRALAVTSDKRLDILPNVPTAAEQGLPGFSYYYWEGLFAPAGTPKDVVQTLSNSLKDALNNPTLKARLESDGTETYYMGPTEFNTFLHKQVSDTATLIKELGIPKQ